MISFPGMIVTNYAFKPRDKKEELLRHIVCLIKLTKSKFQPMHLVQEKEGGHIEEHVICRCFTG